MKEVSGPGNNFQPKGHKPMSAPELFSTAKTLYFRMGLIGNVGHFVGRNAGFAQISVISKLVGGRPSACGAGEPSSHSCNDRVWHRGGRCWSALTHLLSAFGRIADLC